MRGEVRLGADRGDIVIRRHRAQGLQQLPVVREHDKAFPGVGHDVVRRVHHLDAPEYCGC